MRVLKCQSEETILAHVKVIKSIRSVALMVRHHGDKE